MQAVGGKPAGKGRGYHAKNKMGDMPLGAMVSHGSQGADEETQQQQQSPCISFLLCQIDIVLELCSLL